MNRPKQRHSLESPTHCPYCGMYVRSATSSRGREPIDGDTGTCASCHNPSIYKNGALHKITKEEMDALSPEHRAVLEANQRKAKYAQKVSKGPVVGLA